MPLALCPLGLMRVVIVGAGHGGFQLAASLRQNGFDGDIALIGDEPQLPYQRPPLSKDYLSGKIGLDLLLMRPKRRSLTISASSC